MNVGDIALLLLDIFPSVHRRNRVDNFSSLDSIVNASLSIGANVVPPADAPQVDKLYTVASRMGRPNYEEQAKAEALLNALRQMRAKNAARPSHSARVLRGT